MGDMNRSSLHVGINAQGAKESPSIFYASGILRCTKQHGKSNDAQERRADVTHSTGFGAICKPADEYGDNCGN
jgi:hypothetical protein